MDFKFFDNLGEIVYVADMDTYEIVYLNKKAQTAFNLSSLESLACKKCYINLRNKKKPCHDCTNSLLKEGQFHEWRVCNKRLNRVYELKDTMIVQDGRRLRLEIAIDVSNEERILKTANNYELREVTLNRCIEKSLEQKDPNKSIEITLQYLGELFKGDRAYIFEQKGFCWDNTYEWCALDVEPQIKKLQNISNSCLECWMNSFVKGSHIIIENIEHIKDESPELYETLKMQDITSLVAAPAYDGDKVIGFFGIDNPRNDLHDTSNFLGITVSFICYLLRNRSYVQELKFLSFYDQLTGLQNRHSYESFIKTLENNISLGIVYCDITGLKVLNDTQGHEAGDKLITSATKCLKDAFLDYDIFRMGGDEFLVICKNITNENLNYLVDILKTSLKRRKVLMAVGPIHIENYKTDSLQEIMQKAEHMMYKEKELHYKSKAADRRKNKL